MHSGVRPLWWVVSLLLMAGIWTLSSSGNPLNLGLPHPLDWAAHTLEYLVLAYALGRASGSRALALVLAVWFGASDEVHQAFVAGREAGIQDWLSDLLGAWLGSRLATQRERMAESASPPGASEAETLR